MPTCLIVDDSSTMRSIARRMLRQFGYECVEAADGAAALEVIRATGADLVLLDWEMPVMDGLETLKAMRAQSWGRSPKVVMCTSLKDMDRMVAAINAGADEYVMKPYDSDILAGKLSAVGLPV